jgi:hypothetical protein
VLQEADAQGGIGVVEADGQEATFAVEDDGKIAGLAGRALFLNRPVEEPGMALADGAFGGGGDTKGETAAGRCFSHS